MYEALCGHEDSSQFFRIQRQDQVKRHQCVGQAFAAKLRLVYYILISAGSASEDLNQIEIYRTFGIRFVADPIAISEVGFK